MRTASFGPTGLQVTPIGLGLAALGRPGYINLGHGEALAGRTDVASMEAHAHSMLDLAWQLGIRYYDAARSYGRAEPFLASWLAARRLPREQIVVGSKWGYVYTAGWRVDAEVHEVKDHSPELLQRQWGESSALLGGYLRLYQIHSATLESGVLDNRQVLDLLARLKEEGIAIGLSTSGPKQAEVVRRAAEIEIDGARLFDSVQVTWNLLERSTTAALSEARQAGVGVIVKEALANGRLTEQNSDPTFTAQRSLLARQAERLATGFDALALAAVLAQPWVDVVLSGATTAEQLRSNLRALDVVWDQEAEAALQGLAEAPESYWRARAQLSWT